MLLVQIKMCIVRPFIHDKILQLRVYYDDSAVDWKLVQDFCLQLYIAFSHTNVLEEMCFLKPYYKASII